MEPSMTPKELKERFNNLCEDAIIGDENVTACHKIVDEELEKGSEAGDIIRRLAAELKGHIKPLPVETEPTQESVLEPLVSEPRPVPPPPRPTISAFGSQQPQRIPEPPAVEPTPVEPELEEPELEELPTEPSVEVSETPVEIPQPEPAPVEEPAQEEAPSVEQTEEAPSTSQADQDQT